MTKDELDAIADKIRANADRVLQLVVDILEEEDSARDAATFTAYLAGRLLHGAERIVKDNAPNVNPKDFVNNAMKCGFDENELATAGNSSDQLH